MIKKDDEIIKQETYKPSKEDLESVADASSIFAQQAQPKKEIFYVNNKGQTLSSKSSEFGETKMIQEMNENKIIKDWTNGPRNFYENTKNQDTMYAFNARDNLMTTGEYRDKYLNKNDVLASNEIEKANDASYRAMTEQHKKDLREATGKDLETVKKLHTFELSYLDYRENLDKKKFTPQQAADAYKAVKDNYKDYKVSKMGFEVKQNTPDIEQSKGIPTAQEVQKRMLAMRNQAKPKVGISMN